MEDDANLATCAGIDGGGDSGEFFIEEGEDIDDLRKRTPDLVRKQLFKTKMCPFHHESRCQRGADCTFAHTNMELRPLPDLRNTRLCRRVRIGQNCDDLSCPFAHARCDLRTTDMRLFKVRLCNFNRKGKCLNGDHCRFAHGTNELRGSVAVKSRVDTPKEERGNSNGGAYGNDGYDDDDDAFFNCGSISGIELGGTSKNSSVNNSNLVEITEKAVNSNSDPVVVQASNAASGAAAASGVVRATENFRGNNKQPSAVESVVAKDVEDSNNNRPYPCAHSTSSNVKNTNSNPDNSCFLNDFVNENANSVDEMYLSANNNSSFLAGGVIGAGAGQNLGAVSTQVINNNIRYNIASSSLFSMDNSCTSPSNVIGYGQSNFHMDPQQQNQINLSSFNQQERGMLTTMRSPNNVDQSSTSDNEVFANQFASPQSRFCFSNNLLTSSTNGIAQKNDNIMNMNLNANNKDKLAAVNNNTSLSVTNINGFLGGVDTNLCQATNLAANRPINMVTSVSSLHQQQQQKQTSQLRASAPSYSPQMPFTTSYSPPQQQSRAFYGVQQQQTNIDNNNNAASSLHRGASLLPNYLDYITDHLSQQCDISSYTVYGANNVRNINSNSLNSAGMTPGGGNMGGIRNIEDASQIMQQHVDLYSQHPTVQQQHFMAAQPTVQQQQQQQQQMMNAHNNIVSSNLTVSSLGGHSAIPQNAFSSNNNNMNARGMVAANNADGSCGCVETSRYGAPNPSTGGCLSFVDESQSMNMFPAHQQHHSLYDINAHHQNRMYTSLSSDTWNFMNRDVMMRVGGNAADIDIYAQQQQPNLNVYRHQPPIQQASNQNSHTSSFHQAIHQSQTPSSQTLRISSAGEAGGDYLDNSGIIRQSAARGGGMEQSYGGVGGACIGNDIRMSFLSSQQMQQQPQSCNGATQLLQNNTNGSITPSSGMYDDTSFHQGVSDAVYTSAYSEFMNPAAPPLPICTTAVSGTVYHPPIPNVSPYMQQHVSSTTSQNSQFIVGSAGEGGRVMTRCFEYNQIPHNNKGINEYIPSNLQQHQMIQCHPNANSNNNDLSTNNTAVSSMPSSSKSPNNSINSNLYLSFNTPTQMSSFYSNTNGMVTNNITSRVGGMIIGNATAGNVATNDIHNTKYAGDFGANKNNGTNLSAYGNLTATTTTSVTTEQSCNNNFTYDHANSMNNHTNNQYYQGKFSSTAQSFAPHPISPMFYASSFNSSACLSTSTVSYANTSASFPSFSSSCIGKMNKTQHAYTPNSDVGTSPTYAPHSPSSVDSQTTRHSETLSQLTPLSNPNNMYNKLCNKSVTDNNSSRIKNILNKSGVPNNSEINHNISTVKNINSNNISDFSTSITSNSNVSLRSNNSTYGISNSVVSSPNTRSQKHNHVALIRRLSSGDNHLDILSNTLNNNPRTPISQVFAFPSFDLGLNNNSNEGSNNGFDENTSNHTKYMEYVASSSKTNVKSV